MAVLLLLLAQPVSGLEVGNQGIDGNKGVINQSHPTGGLHSEVVYMASQLPDLRDDAFLSGRGVKEFNIVISAGGLDRVQSVVEFFLPVPIKPGYYQSVSSDGEPACIQVLGGNRAIMFIEELSAGEQAVYRLTSSSEYESGQSERPDSGDDGQVGDSASDGDGQAGSRPDECSHQAAGYQFNQNQLTLSHGDGQDVLSYFYRDNEPPSELEDSDLYRRAGYIHPVHTPNGSVVTNHLNVEMHPHHSGIWSAWTRTSFQGRSPDFWNPHVHTGGIEVADTVTTVWDGPLTSGFETTHYYQDYSTEPAVTALNEQWQVSLYNVRAPYRLFDLKLTQTANSSHPLTLEEHLYGGVGFRGHADWDDPDNVTFLTSEGLGRIDGHASRSRWIHIGGEVDGEMAGITIMSHPLNLRHPQPMRIHPDGVFFNYAPSQLGDAVIEPGQPNVMRYRYVTYDVEPDPEQLDKLWYDFAYPPGVSVQLVTDSD